MSRSRVCSRTGCDKRVVGRKLCRNHYQQAWRRGDFENAPPPPRRPSPRVCPPDHAHDATTVCYIQHECRCNPCRDNRAARERRRAKLKAYGRYDLGLVDAAPVREHMMMLAEHGMGYKHVAKVAGIGVTPVRNLIWGRQEPGPRYGELQKRVKRETAEAILAVQPVLENLADRALVKATPYVRRVQALVALGWSVSKIAAELGVLPTNFSVLRRYEAAKRSNRQGRVTISARRARQIVALYERWSVMEPPCETWHEKAACSRARAYARARGWALPMDWEAVDNEFDRPMPVRRSAA